MGTTNAIYQNLNLISNDKRVKWVLLLSSNHLYKMDYLKMLQYHMDTKADLSISCFDVPKSEAHRFGIYVVNNNYNIEYFIERPSDPPEIPDKPGFSFVNMGIYLFNAAVLKDVFLEMDTRKIKSHDFGKDVIPFLVKTGRNIMAYEFKDENKKKQTLLGRYKSII
jgi:glucose-1-phosphate adenylyltransferase